MFSTKVVSKTQTTLSPTFTNLKTLETQLLERARVFSGFTFQIYWKQFFWSIKNKFRLQCHQKRKHAYVMCFRQKWYQKRKLHFHQLYQSQNSNCFLETQLLEGPRVFPDLFSKNIESIFFWSIKNQMFHLLQKWYQKHVSKQIYLIFIGGYFCNVFNTYKATDNNDIPAKVS